MHNNCCSLGNKLITRQILRWYFYLFES